MKRGFTFIEFVVCVAIVGILAAILFPVFNRTHCYETRYPCPGNLKTLDLGMQMYLQDYENTYPIVVLTRPPFGWADAIEPYVAEAGHRFQCSRETTDHPIPGALKTRYTDYWMNGRLSGRAVKKVDLPSRTLLFGDGNEGTVASYQNYAISSLPSQWIGDDGSPLYRHTEGAFYAFADGHVKWLAAAKVTSPTQIGNFVFAPQ